MGQSADSAPVQTPDAAGDSADQLEILCITSGLGFVRYPQIIVVRPENKTETRGFGVPPI